MQARSAVINLSRPNPKPNTTWWTENEALDLVTGQADTRPAWITLTHEHLKHAQIARTLAGSRRCSGVDADLDVAGMLIPIIDPDKPITLSDPLQGTHRPSSAIH